MRLLPDVENLKKSLDKQRILLVKARSEHKRLQCNLEGYETEGYEYFKNTVLPLEMERLDKLRRTETDPEDSRAQLLIQGQQNEVDLLSKNRDEIEIKVKVMNQRISQAEKEAGKLVAKIERLTPKPMFPTEGKTDA